MASADSSFIITTQKWLDTVVIQYNFCPFAKRERDKNSIRFTVDHHTNIEICLLNLITECLKLDSNHNIETTLIIYALNFSDFDDYLDFLAIAEDLLFKQGYEGVYQLASFHPQYCFSDVPENDPSNYTNRSPYPMLHLLREASIDRAMQEHPNPDHIPERNIALTRDLGLIKLQNLLASCYVHQ